MEIDINGCDKLFHFSCLSSLISGSVGRATSQTVQSKRNLTKREPVKIEYEEETIHKEEKFEVPIDREEEEDEKISKSKVSPSKRKGKSPNGTRMKKEKLDESWEPENWKNLLKNIKIMRQEEDAPVDSQGCERTADPDEIPEVNIQIVLAEKP